MRAKVLIPACPTQYSIFPHFLNWKSHLILLQLPKIHSEERPDSKNLLVWAMVVKLPHYGFSLSLPLVTSNL